MSLIVNPPSLYVLSTGDKVSLCLENAGDDCVAFKIKRSNTSYRVKPVYGSIDRDETAMIHITRLSGPAGRNKIVIQTMRAPKDAAACELFNGCASVAKEVCVPLIALETIQNPDGLIKSWLDSKTDEELASYARSEHHKQFLAMHELHSKQVSFRRFAKYYGVWTKENRGGGMIVEAASVTSKQLEFYLVYLVVVD